MSRIRSLVWTCACVPGIVLAACAGDPAPTPPPATSSWRVLAPLADGPRQENGVAVLNGEIFVVGGFDENGAVVADAEAYNPATNTWRRVAPLPAPLHHPNVAVARGRIYVVGALTASNFAATGAVYEYDPLTDTWATRAAMPAGTQRGAAATAAIGDRIYIAGGARGAAVNEFSVYDAAANTWQALPALPTAREHFFAVASGTRIITIGGRAGALRAQVEIFDTANNQWTTGTPLPTPRGGHMGAIVNGRVHVLGGEGNPAPGTNGVFAEHEVYDIAANTWSTAERMRTPRHGTQAVTINGVLYAIGGATRQGFGAVAANEAFAP